MHENKNENELNLEPDTLKELDEIATNQHLHWKENPPTLENNAKAEVLTIGGEFDPLSLKLQGSSNQEVQSAGVILAELFKSFLYDGHTAILADTIVKKAAFSSDTFPEEAKLANNPEHDEKNTSVPEETIGEGVKAVAVDDIETIKKKFEELALSNNTVAKFAVIVLGALSDSLEKGKIAELANIVAVDYPQAFAKNPPVALKEETMPAGTKFSF